MTTSWKRTDHRAMDGHDPKCATFRALPLAELELATFRWASWRGLEAPAPVIGLQDTGGGGNRVLCEPSGASRLTMKAEQKSGHFTGRSGEWLMDASSATMPLTSGNRLNKFFIRRFGRGCGRFLWFVYLGRKQTTENAPHVSGFNGPTTNHHPRKQHKSQKLIQLSFGRHTPPLESATERMARCICLLLPKKDNRENHQ